MKMVPVQVFSPEHLQHKGCYVARKFWAWEPNKRKTCLGSLALFEYGGVLGNKRNLIRAAVLFSSTLSMQFSWSNDYLLKLRLYLKSTWNCVHVEYKGATCRVQFRSGKGIPRSNCHNHNLICVLVAFNFIKTKPQELIQSYLDLVHVPE